MTSLGTPDQIRAGAHRFQAWLDHLFATQLALFDTQPDGDVEEPPLPHHHANAA